MYMRFGCQTVLVRVEQSYIIQTFQVLLSCDDEKMSEFQDIVISNIVNSFSVLFPRTVYLIMKKR